MLDNKMKKGLLDAISEASKQSNLQTTVYAIAESIEITVGELYDYIDQDKEVKKEFEKYINGFKNRLFGYALENKVKDISLPLLKEMGILDPEDSGNDLEVNLFVNDSNDLNIVELEGENVSRETLEEEWEEN